MTVPQKNRERSNMTRTALIAALAVVAASPAIAKSAYIFKLTPGAGGAALRYYDVNAKLKIVAETVTAAGAATCALVEKNTSTSIADPSGSTTQCYGDSDAGEVVGYYLPTSNPNTAVGFTYKGGNYADYIATGSVAANGGTQLNAISKSGKLIAGTYSDASGFSRIFTLKGGKQQDITVADANYLVATGINDTGVVTAQSFDANNNLVASLLIDGSSVTTIAYPGGTLTTTHVINNSGVLVGAYTDAKGVRHGYTYDSTTRTYSAPINAPKVAATGLLGINTKGVVSGSATPKGGTAEGLIGTPAK